MPVRLAALLAASRGSSKLRLAQVLLIAAAIVTISIGLWIWFAAHVLPARQIERELAADRKMIIIRSQSCASNLNPMLGRKDAIRSLEAGDRRLRAYYGFGWNEQRMYPIVPGISVRDWSCRGGCFAYWVEGQLLPGGEVKTFAITRSLKGGRAELDGTIWSNDRVMLDASRACELATIGYLEGYNLTILKAGAQEVSHSARLAHRTEAGL